MNLDRKKTSMQRQFKLSPAWSWKKKGNMKKRKRKSDYWFFSISWFVSHKWELQNQKAPHNFSLSFIFPLLSSPLSSITVLYLCQISILVHLCNPPLWSPADFIFFCLTAAPRARGGWGGVVAISRDPQFYNRVGGWRRKRRKMQCGWSKMISAPCFLPCSVPFCFVLPLNVPNGFLMTVCRHHTPSHL